MSAERKQLIKSLIIDHLNLKIDIKDFKDDMPLFGEPDDPSTVGLDSVDALELSVALIGEFEVEITDENMHIFESVNTIDEFISEQLQAA